MRRIIGIDLGVTTAHTACVIDAEGSVLARRKVRPLAGELAALREAALAGAGEGCRLEIVMDPTGSSWLPLAVFFDQAGDTVFRIASAEAHDLRRVLRRRAKTNRIDAEALAKLAIVERGELHPLQLPRGEAAALDRQVRATDRLTAEIARRKNRIRDLARTLMPTVGEAISKTMGRADLEVLRTYGNPKKLVDPGLEGLTTLVAEASLGRHGKRKAQAYHAAAMAALGLYRDSDAVALDALADELATEINLLEILEALLAPHSRAREESYRAVDPAQLARSLPGIALVGAPTAVAATIDARRFGDADRFASYTGLVPRASETGDTDRKGQPMTKAGNKRLRKTFYRAADTARKLDPQLARIYHEQMVHRGANHAKATAIVAAHLARRFCSVMARGTPYVLRDVDGREVSAAEAKQIIAERYTVTEDVRARRRSRKKTGKVPHQALEGHVTRARSAITRRPSLATIVASREELVKNS